MLPHGAESLQDRAGFLQNRAESLQASAGILSDLREKKESHEKEKIRQKRKTASLEEDHGSKIEEEYGSMA